ncbi:hypothetical protein KDD93_06855 [Campylobacter sp. faydin G-24]|uniref:Uncharacterized protein n=1 Tax=Campylobacter anatolicus TaxID=2829105 RepID=A0ABS5HJ31_9BACT|nr:putative phage tail assembly chaperone [Campylobacter anatolicus]MBR8464279.1 hypothetical protein [Campylobacter anatolicus]
MEALNLDINGLNYTLRQANFFETKGQFSKLLSIAKEAVKMQGANLDVDIGQIIANIGSETFNGVESFVLKYASVTDESGREILFKNRAEAQTHFNKHRSHYIPLMIEGLKYHFLDLLPDTLKSSMPTTALIV